MNPSFPLQLNATAVAAPAAAATTAAGFYQRHCSSCERRHRSRPQASLHLSSFPVQLIVKVGAWTFRTINARKGMRSSEWVKTRH